MFWLPRKNKFQLLKKMTENDFDIKCYLTENTFLEIKSSAADEILRQKQLCALNICEL